jgi:hypothetical protein
MILIAGPYRSGTNDDPALMKKNVEEMESHALAIFRAGHIPVLGEWLALPLVHLCGSTRVGMKLSMKSSIQSPFGLWRSVTLCFAWAALRAGPMRWCEWGGAWG